MGIFMIIVAILSGIASLLRILDWWRPKTKRGERWRQRMLNHVIAQSRKLEMVAVERYGCVPGGKEDPAVLEEKEPEAVRVMRGTGAWFPGKELVLSLAPKLIDYVALPWARELAGKSPLPINYNDADLKALLLETLEESQT